MWKLLFTAAVAVGVAFLLPSQPSSAEPTVSSESVNGPVVGQASRAGVSDAVSALVSRRSKRPSGKLITTVVGPSTDTASYVLSRTPDTGVSIGRFSSAPMPTPSLSFDGLANYDNITAYNAVIIPPDTIGEVGPNHYVQAINALVRIFDKNGNALTPPFRLSQLFASLGTVCAARDDGEPIVVYDPLADRWILSQYCNAFPPFRQMIAVSQTGDPTGAYFVYEFVMPNIRLNDFAKFGVWPDGYYMSTEEFTGADFSGQGMFAFDRGKMLVGDPTASYIYFSRDAPAATRRGNLLPSDLDGLRPPAAGSPNVFVGYTATEYGDAQDALQLYDFHADFVTPANSTFIERSESPLAVAAFDPTSPDGREDIAQPPPGAMLDANSDRLSYRAAYRNFGSSESLVLSQTVRLSQVPYRAGVRLYELRRSGGSFTVAEQSTIGDASSSRWIGSAAQDGNGNLAVGYNHVADDRQPSLFYTGRLAGEPAGTFRDEGTLITGTGVQRIQSVGRWGDYSGMSVDPVDDCTFWMTGEYYTLQSQQFHEMTWLTRIGRFKFPECTPTPRSTITGVVTNVATGQPLDGAIVSAAAYSRRSGPNGGYGELAVLPGTYDVAANMRGFREQSVTLALANGQAATQNFALEPMPVLDSTGTTLTSESCAINGAPDPGEVVTISIALRNTGSIPTQNLTATLIAGGGVIDPGAPQNYGSMPVNSPAISRPFIFTVDPATLCGSKVTMTLHLQDGVSDLGNISIELQTGKQQIAFSQSFDRTPLGFLPPRWSRSESHSNQFEPHGERNWRASNTRSTAGGKSAFSKDLQFVGVNEMVSPAFRVQSSEARVRFQNWYELETTFLRNRRYDGSILEIRIGDGEWQNITAAGGVFEAGGYDGPIDTCCQNPLGGEPGWSGRSGINQASEFILSVARLPASAVGQIIQLRWRIGTDIGTFREGQYIDDLVVTDGYRCGCLIP